jgi:hypothetical protein
MIDIVGSAAATITQPGSASMLGNSLFGGVTLRSAP